MAGILVYLPGSTGNNGGDELKRVGLAELLDRSVSPIATPIVTAGPDGGGGRLITFDSPNLPATPTNIDMATQEWKPAPPSGELPAGRYWLGYVKDQRPTPAELQRADLCDGEPVILRDGNQWVVPIADYLPKRLTVDPSSGKEVREVAERHRAFVHWADSLYEYFLSDGFAAMLEKDLVVQIPDGLAGVAMALAKNYRVNRDVVDLLELVEEYEAFEVVKVAIGMAGTLRAISEKKNTEQFSHSLNAN
jgi:hypothetical protein